MPGGTSEIEFRNFHVSTDKPSVFVVMQFGMPYDDLYREVIEPVSLNSGFQVLRGDDVFRPGVILQDIIRSIIESDVIIADITPTNANVFYELGSLTPPEAYDSPCRQTGRKTAVRHQRISCHIL